MQISAIEPWGAKTIFYGEKRETIWDLRGKGGEERKNTREARHLYRMGQETEYNRRHRKTLRKRPSEVIGETRTQVSIKKSKRRAEH